MRWTPPGVGWGMHAESLIAPHLAAGTPVERAPASLRDVPMHWEASRAASIVLDCASRAVLAAARNSLHVN